jgi:hypothetical protein
LTTLILGGILHRVIQGDPQIELETNEEIGIAEAAQRLHLPGPVILTFAHLDARALGMAIGLVCGLFLFIATIILILRGGEVIGHNLSLLSQYFPGYSVTWKGSLVGFLYAAAAGFILGYCFAQLRNRVAHIYLISMRRRAERDAIGDLL